MRCTFILRRSSLCHAQSCYYFIWMSLRKSVFIYFAFTNFVAGDRLSSWYSQDPITLNELRRSHRPLLIVRSIFRLLTIRKVLQLGYTSWRLENGIRDVLISTFTCFHYHTVDVHTYATELPFCGRKYFKMMLKIN